MPECPECHSQRVWKDGLRETALGTVQRWICRDCAYRFSETHCNNQDKADFQRKLDTPLSFFSGSEHSEGVQELQPLTLRSGVDKPVLSRVGASDNGAKNLVISETRTQEQAAGATNTDNATNKGRIIELGWHLNRERYSQYTIKNYMKFLSMLLKRGANLNDPDDVKDKIAEQQWSASGKNIAIAAYTIFASLSGLHWNPPIYKTQQKLPFIPLENELDALIAMSNKKLATVLQLMKEGGMRIGEALALSWIDVDLENNTVTVNSPEKEGRPRMLKISNKLAAMINALPRKNNKIFGTTPYSGVHSTFVRTRSRAAEKLQNPRLRYIKFHTFRHWKATTEYHKTKDLLHVRQMLGHRKIETTLLYTQLITFENDDYHSAVAKTVDEARSLVETGFEYICTHDDIMIFRKRK